VSAQQAPSSAAPPPATAAPSAQAQSDLDFLISILGNDARRQALLDRLRAERAAQTPVQAPAAGPQGAPPSAAPAQGSPPGAAPAPAAAPPAESQPEAIVQSLSDQVRTLSEGALKFAAAVSELPHIAAEIMGQFRNPEFRSAQIDALWRVVATLATGLVLEALAAALLARAHRQLQASVPRTVIGRFVALIGRAIIEAVPVAIFVAAALSMLPVVLPLGAPLRRARFAAVVLIYAHAVVRSALILARILVAPGTPALRLIATSDETSEYLYIWIRRLAVVAIYGTAAANAARLLGASALARLAILKADGALIAVLLIIFVLQNRAAVARVIARGGRDGVLMGIRRPLAEVWHVPVILYVIGLFGVWLVGVRGGFEYLGRASIGTVVIVLGGWAAIAAMKRLMVRAFRLSPDLNRRFPGLEARANRYLPVLREVVRGVVWLFGILLVLNVWGVRSFRWLNSGAAVQAIGSAVAIGVIVVIALVLWESFTLVLERYSARLVAAGAGRARARTLLPLFRTTALIVITVLAGLVALTEIGVNITPLLAGAGVIGLAVGVGSQKLVQDVINGVFILVEDTIAIGDVVDVGGGHAGVVETISIRSMRLRDGTGAIHTVPFSEVHIIQNNTRDFSRAIFEVEVAYREDIDRVIAAMREVGEAVSKDEAFAPLVIEPFKIIGVDKVKGSGVVVMAQISTLAGKQWDVARTFNLRLKQRFDELKIEMPSGRTVVYVRGAADGASDESTERKEKGHGAET
jgi:small conductance mechanosensitive channel